MIKKIANILKKSIDPATKIGYTTIGILIAFWINNWDDSRKKQEIEHKTLMEIRSGLLQDKKDLLETIEGYQYRVIQMRYFFELLGRKTIPPDSMATCVSSLNGFSFQLANTAAYETLKSRGLETITNDSLRLMITTLYELDYQMIVQNEHYLSQFQNTIFMPHLMNEVHLGAKTLTATEIKKLKADRPFHRKVWEVKRQNEFIQEHYIRALQKVESLMTEINKEIKIGF